MRKELDKCILVCANCHSEIHNGDYDTDIIESIFHKDLLLRDERLDTIFPKTTISEYNCKSCKTVITNRATYCVSCFAKSREKINWPTNESILKSLESTSFEELARELNVSSNAIRKRLKK